MGVGDFVEQFVSWYDKEERPTVVTTPSVHHEANAAILRAMQAVYVRNGSVRDMLQAAFDLISFRGGLALLGARVLVEHAHPQTPGVRAIPVPGYELARVSVQVSVPDRETAQPITIGQGEPVALRAQELFQSPLTIVQRLVRDKMAALLLHELDESLCIDGKRVWDPHEGENRGKA
jgi:hypothetical protein